MRLVQIKNVPNPIKNAPFLLIAFEFKIRKAVPMM